MILTPQELQKWIYEGKSFTMVDIRPEEHRAEFPLTNLDASVSDMNSIPESQKVLVLICQFGIVTEGIIIEQELNNAYSLLGGALAWIEFQSEKKDLSQHFPLRKQKAKEKLQLIEVGEKIQTKL